MTTRSVVLLVFVAVVGLTVAPVASGAAVGTVAADETNESTSNTTVSTLMQASAADVESTVDEELFEAKYEAADNDSRQAIVRDRTGDIEQRLEELEAEREELRERKDDLHPGEYRSRLAKLSVEITSLERAIDRVEDRAVESGVGKERVDALRSNASKLSGPEVAEMARGLGVDGTPGNGPPDDPGNQSRGNGNGQGNDRSPGNSDRGPPNDESNNATIPGRENGSGPGMGNGNGSGSEKKGSPGNGSGSENGADSRNGNGQGNGADSRDGTNPRNGNGSGPGADSDGSAETDA
ncbi:hypothetical protein [Haloterrigena alkaliphila]|uniref:Uncharacterized protein n=1 Tax=Haloterrigena alkaliphila TaxID=2816475 RepID=A0A8A2V7L3_9EURY|nr:hypothetical protein [Haloterrigena alkaliphila]QSW97813.1 hypothetical protein J0X25_10310 [Haloterrigena alkaliphila]